VAKQQNLKLKKIFLHICLPFCCPSFGKREKGIFGDIYKKIIEPETFSKTTSYCNKTKKVFGRKLLGD
jgi:hypothetical protein